MPSILFVCLGNICRSPLAEGIARHISETKSLNLKVDSAGTGSWHVGEPPCENSVKVAALHGLDISTLRARQVSVEDLKKFDLIIALDQNNYNDLKKMGAAKLYKLGYFGFNNEDIPDPYFFNGFEGFEKVYEMIETAVTILLEEFEK